MDMGHSHNKSLKVSCSAKTASHRACDHKYGADSPGGNVIAAQSGKESAVLPISSSLPQLPESPKSPFAAQLKPTSSVDSSSSSGQSECNFDGHLLAGRGSVNPKSMSTAEAFDEVSLHGTQVR